MENFNANHFSGLSLDHLGLVADQIDNLGIISSIDERLPLAAGCGVKTTMGERVAAMIFNGLGFIDTRLYMFPEFLEKKPVERLFSKDLKADWFNDDATGRCLDAISKYGTTKLFTELSFAIGIKHNLLGRSANFDTSTLQLSGEYPDCESTKDQAVVPARGYSKSHRHDLKQMVINLATTGKANFPIWMESHSGNASDKKILPAAAHRMKELCDSLKEAPSFMYVGDSALYSNILEFSTKMKWLTRVPSNILQAKQLLKSRDEKLNWLNLGEEYNYHVAESNYGNVQQRWVLIFSKQAYKREISTLTNNITKEFTAQEKVWKNISKKLFINKVEAEIQIKNLTKKIKFHKITSNILELIEHEGRGRPNKNTESKIKGYKIEFSIERDEARINLAKIQKGRFILSTNELDVKKLPDNEILKEYKAQSGVERSFKFIKDNSFELDSVFLEKPGRIEALMMIMTLCLMVYGVSQYTLREALLAANETIPDQKRKPTNKPSLKWVYFLFLGAHELTMKIENKIKTVVINVNALFLKILNYFGPRVRQIYLNSA